MDIGGGGDDKGKEEIDIKVEAIDPLPADNPTPTDDSIPRDEYDPYERGGEDPGDGTGEELYDTGVPGLPFDVANMSKTYGPCQRGAVAPRSYMPGKVIMHEVAAIWVATSVAPLPSDAKPWEIEARKDYERFFHGTKKTMVPPYHICPPQLSPPAFPKGGLHVAVTGLMIAHQEEKAEIICGDSEWALHGSLDLLNFPAPQDCYEIAKNLYFADKADRWDLKRFGRLFGVIQVGAHGFHDPYPRRLTPLLPPPPAR